MTLAVLMIAAPSLAGDPMQEVSGLTIVQNLLGPDPKILEARDLGSLYEIVVPDPRGGKGILYVTKDGSYIVAGGSVFNNDKMNVTKERYDEILKKDLAKLPLNDSVVLKKGNGTKKLYVFTDVDCPFCRQAHEWLKQQNDFTAYIFLLPLEIHPKAREKSVGVLCEKDRLSTLDLAMSGKEMTPKRCESGEKLLEVHKAAVDAVGVRGTPLFITETGQKISGFQQEVLDKYLKGQE